jgi:hypothetical protein
VDQETGNPGPLKADGAAFGVVLVVRSFAHRERNNRF